MNENEVKSVMVKVSISEDLRYKFKLKCLQNKTNMNSVILEFIEKYIDENDK